MYAISLGQKEAVQADPLADYIPTSHVGVEIGDGVGLHYPSHPKTRPRSAICSRAMRPLPQQTDVEAVHTAGHNVISGREKRPRAPRGLDRHPRTDGRHV